MSPRRLLAVLLGLVLIAAACNGGGEEVDVGADDGDGDQRGGELVAAIGGEPDTLDPHMTTAYPSFQVLENVYDTLVQPGPDLQVEPALASEWEVSDDELTWTFTLREGVTWHNGRDLVADDVVFSMNRIKEEGANGFRLEPVEQVTAPDDRTVVFELNRPAPNLPIAIGGFKGLAIVPPEIVEDGSIDTEPVGTGPFQFVEFVPGDRVVLERNPDYWQDGLPYLDRVVFRPISDNTVKLTNLQTGEVDWVDSVPPQRLGELEDADDVVVEAVPGGDYWYMAMNLEREPFGQREVRRAFATAIDRAEVTEAAMFEAATPTQIAIPESSVWYHDYAPFEHDSETAAAALRDAGVPEGFEMDLMVTNEYPETITAAQVIASQLGEVGVEVQIRELDFSAWLEEQGEGNFDSLLLGWLGNIDPDDYYYAQHHSEGGFNFQGYSNPDVDQLLDEARRETDRDARKDLYDRAAETIVDEVSYLYLYNPDVVNAWRPDVEGYSTRPDAAIRFEETRLAS